MMALAFTIFTGPLGHRPLEKESDVDYKRVRINLEVGTRQAEQNLF